MKNWIHPWAPALVATLCCACGDTTVGGQTGDEGALPGAAEFYGDLGAGTGFGNYQPAADLAELAQRSERVVLGRPVAWVEGRSLIWNSNEEPIQTMVLHVEVEEDFKGEASERVYVEFRVGYGEGGAPPPDAVPPEQVLLFLIPAETILATEDAGKGLPSEAQLHVLPTPQGLAYPDEDGFHQPFEPGDTALGGGAFEELLQELRDTVQAAERTATDAG